MRVCLVTNTQSPVKISIKSLQCPISVGKGSNSPPEKSAKDLMCITAEERNRQQGPVAYHQVLLLPLPPLLLMVMLLVALQVRVRDADMARLPLLIVPVLVVLLW